MAVPRPDRLSPPPTRPQRSALSWHLVLLSFALIFPVELPDKTFVAALVLATRYPGLAVWIGVGLAFGVQSLVAVTAGSLVSLFPHVIVEILSTAMFIIGAIVLVRSAPRAMDEEKEAEEEISSRAPVRATGMRAAAASFLLIFAAEWGDLSQILTLNLVAKQGHPVSVFIGSWAALLVVSGLAVVSGRVLLRYLRLDLLHYFAATVCVAFAVVGTVQIAS
jgi:Ca2+/H+ antiporter, TMEM165/GDT1 family